MILKTLFVEIVISDEDDGANDDENCFFQSYQQDQRYKRSSVMELNSAGGYYNPEKVNLCNEELSLIVRDWENRNILTISCFQEVFQQSQGFQKSSLRSEVIFNHSTVISTFGEMDFFLPFKMTSSQTFESLSWLSTTCVSKNLVDIVTSSIGFGWWI